MIKLFCPRCGGVDVPLRALHLELWRGDRPNTYRFVCPACEDRVEKPAGPSVLRAVEEAQEAGSAGESPPVAEAPPLTPDDLLDFHLQLQSDDAIAKFLDPNAAAYDIGR